MRIRSQRKSPPVVLSIAGSDCSGGAGIQADLKTMHALGVYGTTVITCVVAENAGRVKSVTPLNPKRIREQIEMVLEAFSIAGIKIGMVYDARIVEAIASALQPLFRKHGSKVPLVIDPVSAASAGGKLLKPGALAQMKKLLFPWASCITPNKDEAELLWGKKIKDAPDLLIAAATLSEHYGVPFLVKGGHLPGTSVYDALAWKENLQVFHAPRVRVHSVHGTGCTLSTAIACGLAQGLDLEAAVASSKKFITHAIRERQRIGKYDVLNHNFAPRAAIEI